ncbi:hypothetical protein LMG3412_05175 [Achromobacter deleyi]|nr:hypothetical protein LMG3412_05175 [Achromobacter deleyi]
MRGLAVAGSRIVMPHRQADDGFGTLQQLGQFAPNLALHVRRAGRHPSAHVAVQAPDGDARSGMIVIGRHTPAIRILVDLARRGMIGRISVGGKPDRIQAGHRLARLQRRRRDHARKVPLVHHRHHARHLPGPRQVDAGQAAPAITRTVPGRIGGTQGQAMQRVGRQRGGQATRQRLRGVQGLIHTAPPGMPAGGALAASAFNCTARHAACMISTCVPQRHRL